MYIDDNNSDHSDSTDQWSLQSTTWFDSEESPTVDSEKPSLPDIRIGPIEPGVEKEKNIWDLPGLDKTTFYASALYLHVAAKGQLRDPEHHGLHRQPTTDARTRDFLDRLADCFARSKDGDQQAHVSATGMVRNRSARRITVYVAKNLSGKNINPQETAETGNEDEDFARKLEAWFNTLSEKNDASGGEDQTWAQDLRSWLNEEDEIITPPLGEMWDAMRKFNTSRLRYYMDKAIACWVEEPPDEAADQNSVWQIVNPMLMKWVDARKRYTHLLNQQIPDATLDVCIKEAWRCRRNFTFSRFITHVDEIIHDEESDLAEINFARAVKWIDFLGRLVDAYLAFHDFCTAPEHQGFQFSVVVLKSPPEEPWDKDLYKAKLESWFDSWDDELAVEDDRGDNRKTVRDALDAFCDKSRDTARVHCEIQLLNYFSQLQLPDDLRPLDYIGCSKTSCWLCWQLLGCFGGYTTKGTHRMIYPMWAFPSDFRPSDTRFARALVAIYRGMVALIQEKVLLDKEFSSRPNITHTSLRHNESLLGEASNQDIAARDQIALQHLSAETDLFSLDLIPGRVPVATVPVIHIPASSGGADGESARPRVIDAHIYEQDDSERAPSLEFEDDIWVMLNFQIRSWAEQPAASLQELNPEQRLEMRWWMSELVYGGQTQGNMMFYVYLFRKSGTFERNPWLLKMMKELHGDDFREDSIPWFGDVIAYATKTPENPLTGSLMTDQEVWVRDRNELDVEAFEAALKRRYDHPNKCEEVVEEHSKRIRKVLEEEKLREERLEKKRLREERRFHYLIGDL